MSDRVDQPELPEVDDTGRATDAGLLLTRARESAGLSIDALAATLKVPVGKLQALESGRWDLLPDTVFARALAASVCRLLKTDPAAVMAGLPSATPRPIATDQGINRPFRDAAHGSGGLSSHLTRPLTIGVVLLLIGALVLLLMPTVRPLSGWFPGTSPAVGVDTASLAPVASVAQVQTERPAVETALLPRPEAAKMMTEPAALASVPRPTAVYDSVSATASATIANVDPQKLEADMLVFSTSGESWVEVTDARGRVVFKQMLSAGQTASASGAAPLTIVIGRADATRLLIKGKPFDVVAHARNNVARFEVTP